MLEDHEILNTSIASRWGPVVADGGYGSGWTAVPSALIRNIGSLGLNGTDFAVLAIILSYWWDRDKLPSPRIAGIATMLDLSPRSVERSVVKLCSKNLLIRRRAYQTPAGMCREFDLTPLVEKVSELASHDLRVLAENREREQAKVKLSEELSVDFDLF